MQLVRGLTVTDTGQHYPRRILHAHLSYPVIHQTITSQPFQTRNFTAHSGFTDLNTAQPELPQESVRDDQFDGNGYARDGAGITRQSLQLKNRIPTIFVGCVHIRDDRFQFSARFAKYLSAKATRLLRKPLIASFHLVTLPTCGTEVKGTAEHGLRQISQ